MICIPWTLNSNALKLAAKWAGKNAQHSCFLQAAVLRQFPSCTATQTCSCSKPLFKACSVIYRWKSREMRPTLWFCTVSSTGGHAQSPGCAVPRLNWNQLVLSEHFRTKSSPPRLEKGELLMQLLTKSVVPSVGFDPIALWVEQSCCLKQGQSRHKPFWSYFRRICWPIFLNLQLACFKRGIPFFQLCLSPPFEI